jgi:hypothetical protein
MTKPALPNNFSLGPKRFWGVFKIFVISKFFASWDAQTLQKLWPSKKINFGKKIYKTKPALPNNFSLGPKRFLDVFKKFVISKFFASWDAQTLQKLWPSKSRASNYFLTSGRKSLCKSLPFSTAPTSGGPFHGCLGPKRPARFSLA